MEISSQKPKTASSPFEPPVVAPSLLDGVMEELGLSLSPDAQHIRQALVAHVNAFALGRFLGCNSPSVHEDANRAREMARLIDRLRDEAGHISPVMQVLFDVRFSEMKGGAGAQANLFADLAVFQKMLARFGEASFAKNRKDNVLRDAIGGLMLYFETLTGNRATVQRAQSHFGKPPRLSSPEARSIGALLRVVEPGLADTTIVNKIVEISTTHRGRPLTEFEHRLFLCGRITHI